MKRGHLAGLAASLVLHGALVAGVLLAAPGEELLPALLIDLTEEITAAAERPTSGPARSVRARAPAPPRGDERPTVASTDRVGAALPAPEPPAAAPPAPVEPAAPPATPAPEDPSVVPPAPSAATVLEPTATAPVTSTELLGPQQASAGGSPDDSARPSNSGPTAGVIGGQTPAGGDATLTAARDPDGTDIGARAGQDLALAVPGSIPADPGAMYAGYLGRLRQRIHEALHYPAAARRRSLTGTVTVEVTILPDGAIGPVRVVESSAHPVLDEAAVDSVRSLRPQPFPRELPARTLRVRLPVVFELR